MVGLNRGLEKGLGAKEAKHTQTHSRTHTTSESVRAYTALECRTERAATVRKQEMQESPLSSVSVTTGFRLKVRLTRTVKLNALNTLHALCVCACVCVVHELIAGLIGASKYPSH